MPYSAEEYQQKRDAFRLAQQRYYRKNREKILARQKKYDDEHRDQIAARFKEKQYYRKQTN